jgi:hypothetical protein
MCKCLIADVQITNCRCKLQMQDLKMYYKLRCAFLHICTFEICTSVLSAYQKKKPSRKNKTASIF